MKRDIRCEGFFKWLICLFLLSGNETFAQEEVTSLSQRHFAISLPSPDSSNKGRMNQGTILLDERQVIILKADDLVFHDSLKVFSAQWERYLSYIISKKIPSSVGVIMNSLDKGNAQYAKRVKELQEKFGIELWNHGYTHDMKSKNERGETTYEFWKTPEQFQLAQFLKSQKAASEKLGLTIRTFGSPGNGMDSSTTKAIEKIPELEVWLYGDPKSNKFVLKRIAKNDLEHPVHNPDFTNFQANYDASQPYLLLQYHPMSWDEKRFEEFKKIIGFLLDKHVRFMTPYAYYQEVKEKGKKADG